MATRMRFSRSYPRSWCSRLPRLRASMMAPATRTTEMVACAISKALRVKVPWLPVLRPAPAKRFDGLRMRGEPGRRGSEEDSGEQGQPDGKAQHRQRRHNADGHHGGVAKAIWISSRVAPIATARPATPPSRDNKTLSASACEMTCLREAPMARRTAVWERRAAARASSRLATLAQAISSTIPQTARSICRLRP